MPSLLHRYRAACALGLLAAVLVAVAGCSGDKKVTISGTTLSTRAAMKAEGKAQGMSGVKEEHGEHHIRANSVKMVSTTCS